MAKPTKGKKATAGKSADGQAAANNNPAAGDSAEGQTVPVRVHSRIRHDGERYHAGDHDLHPDIADALVATSAAEHIVDEVEDESSSERSSTSNDDSQQ